MQQKLSRNPIAFFTVLAAFAWNIAILLGVVFNAQFALTRAAGGQFTSFPVGLRIVYLLQLVLVIYQVWIFKLIFHTEPVSPAWAPRLFVYIGVLGILMNSASRSANERWNVIVAVIITWAFWYYGMKKASGDLVV